MHYFGLENRKLRKVTINRVYDFIHNNGDRLIKDKNLIFDKISLANGISLNCYLCPKKYGCCNGSPFKVTDDYKNMIKIILKDLDYKDIKTNIKQIFNKSNIIKELKDNENKNHCIMMQDINSSMKGCVLQKYAVDHGDHPLKYKPISCALFPLDIIVLDDHRYFIFSKTIDDNDPINKLSRFWESVKYMPCMSGTKDGFILQKPIYIEFEKEIRFYLGDNSYERIYRFFQQS
jgi:hypothetical protein